MAVRRIAKLAYHVVRSNLVELHYPYRLTYAVTNRCQAHCSMCNIWRKTADGELTMAEIDTFFARSNRFSWINLTGGEIFQRDDIVEIIRSVDRHCRSLYLLNFPTNGYQTEKIVAAVADILTHTSIPRLMVSVSLDGPCELHDSTRGLPGSWEQALATFRQLRIMRSRRFSVYLGYTMQESNLHAFQETVDAARSELGELSVDEIHVNLAHISGHYYDNSSFSGLPDPVAAGEILTRIRGLRSRRFLDPVSVLERRYQKLARTFQQTGAVPLTCQAAAASCFIDPGGVVYPCTAFDAPLGTLREHGYDLYRLWRSAGRHSIRKAVCDGACPRCWTPCEAYQTILANLLT
ncbi:MAG: radical SAM protein [Steroidobacteraceae bacterium]|nr:radical SAM protein [Deltaproteobacteria bacterium]